MVVGTSSGCREPWCPALPSQVERSSPGRSLRQDNASREGPHMQMIMASPPTKMGTGGAESTHHPRKQASVSGEFLATAAPLRVTFPRLHSTVGHMPPGGPGWWVGHIPTAEWRISLDSGWPLGSNPLASSLRSLDNLPHVPQCHSITGR